MAWILTLISSVAFIVYGALCVFSEHMKSEFERYGLLKFRKLVGILELLGGLGLLLGTLSKALLVFSASGLSLLMLLGLATRLRVRDRPIEMIPAAALLLLNLAIVFMAMNRAT
jgi:hypothetical protein